MSTPPYVDTRLPTDLHRAIGRVATLWAQLEHVIDGTIRQALDHPQAPAIDTALIVPFRKRIELLLNLYASLDCCAALNDEWAIPIAKDALRLQRLRDLVVHGSVAHSEHLRRGKTVYAFRRIRWDRPVRLLEMRSLTIADVDAVADQISDLIAYSTVLELAFWEGPPPSGGAS